MNLTFREVKDIISWNKFVTFHNPWSLFQSWQWGEVQKALNQRVIRLGIYQENRLIGVSQIFVVRARRGTFLHVRHGPVWTPDVNNRQDVWIAWVSFLKDLVGYEQVWFLRISPMIADSPANQQLLKVVGFQPSPIHRMDGEICWVLDLDESNEQLLVRMRKTTRYLIRQAEKLNVTIEESKDIDAFLSLYGQTASRHAFVPHQGIKEEFAVFSKSGNAHLLLAFHERKLLAGAVILFFADRAIYHHGASLSTKIPASYLLQWHAIQYAKERGARLYNFWGVAAKDQPRHPWQGITLFKQGFGGREARFIHAHDLPLSPFYVFSYTIEKVRKLIKGY